MEIQVRGQIVNLGIKNGIAKISFETDLERVKLDEIKLLLNKGIEVIIADNQSTLQTFVDAEAGE